MTTRRQQSVVGVLLYVVSDLEANRYSMAGSCGSSRLGWATTPADYEPDPGGCSGPSKVGGSQPNLPLLLDMWVIRVVTGAPTLGCPFSSRRHPDVESCAVSDSAF